MKQNEKIWAVLVHLSMHMWAKRYETLPFDDEMWDCVLEESVEAGINMIVLDLGDGIRYASHPEIAMQGAWSRERVREEVKRCRELGIALIPKLNFSATHDAWLGEYERMLSTQTYYKVCRDLITEVAELFDHPRYIHLGMDEEDARHAQLSHLAVFRHKDLLWHDLKFYFDCVRDTGATPWIWADPCFNYPEDFRKQIRTGELVLTPWMYNAIYPEHLTPVSSRQAYVEYYAKEPYASMNIQYVEEDPFIVRFMKNALPCVEDGYTVIPGVSTCNKCRYNALDMLRYYKENADPDRVAGFITAPWAATVPERAHVLLRDIRVFGKAKKEVYDGITPEPGQGAADINLIDLNEEGVEVY